MNTGKTSKKRLSNIFIIIGTFVIVGLVIFTIVKGTKSKTSSIDIGENNVNFTEEKVGSDNIDMMKQNAYSIDINSKTISITASGTLLEVEKIQNIDALNQQLEKTNEDYYDFLDFEDSDPVFTEEKVGDDIYRKMYSKNYKFDLRSPIINGYNLNNLEQQEILDVGKQIK